MPNNHDYIETINGVSFKMIFVEGGEVIIRYGDDSKKIIVPDFHIAETPCTQALWRAVMSKDPDELGFKGRDQNPVERVSWLDIVEGNPDTGEPAFLSRLNQLAQFGNYHLPSEAMWQYAAQGGNKSEGYQYAGSDHLKEVGWFEKNSHEETKPVKLKLPNEIGLYDMSGNVCEWCADHGTENVKDLPVDGKPFLKKNSSLKVVRGGSWYYIGYISRIASRVRSFADFRYDYYGFRIARY